MEDDNIQLNAGVALHMPDEQTALLNAGASLYMNRPMSIKNEIDQVEEIKPYETVFVGYDLKDVEEARKETVRQYQEILYEKCKKYDIPFNVMMVILSNESGGLFNTNGVIHANSNGTIDSGLFQINSCNYKNIEDNLHITKDEILNDPEKNIEAACFHFRTEILDRYGKNYEEDMKKGIYIGPLSIYNGGIGNKDTKAAQKYAYNAQAKIDNEFNKTIDELTRIIYYDKDDEHAKTR